MAGSSGVTKIDSNITGLRYSIEQSLCVLQSNPEWTPLEPNEYNSFGGEITTVARNPIQASRQRKKGTVTDLEATAGFQTDLTQANLQELLQAFLFADFREKFDTQPFNGTAITITGVTTLNDEYAAASGLDAVGDGDLIFASGFTDAANNGLKTGTTGGSATAFRVAENLVDEGSPPAGARLSHVGFQFDTGDAVIDVAGSRPALTTTTKDLTTLGLVIGEEIFLGGDALATQFDGGSGVNNGFKRIRSIAANRIEFDKSTNGDMVADTGTGKTVQLFFGRVLRNEANPDNIVRRTVQFERTLGSNTADANVQAEYVVGGVASEATFNFPSADKATVDLSFVGTDSQVLDENNLPTNFPGAESGTAADAIKSQSTNLGSTAPGIDEADAFNTSSDVKNIRLYVFNEADENPDPLFAFASEVSVSVNNNVSGNKAVGVLGNFEVTAGTFEVGGNITAYFADVAAISAVRNNANATLDFALVKANGGIHFDIPLITLGGGQPDVSQDEPITVALETAAATGAFIDANLDYTLQLTFFDYLPTLADV